MGVKLITGPALEPITPSEAKLHLRVSHATEDVPIAAWIVAARETVENYTNRQLITATWELYLDQWCASDSFIELPQAPIQAVTYIKYYDENSELQTLSTDTYQLDEISEPGRIYLAGGATWPRLQNRRNAVVIRYTCGYGDAAINIPGPLKSAMLLIIGHLYENRQDVVTGVTSHAIPKGSTALMAPYRVMRF